MTVEEKQEVTSHQVSTFGVELLRDVLLPEILGKHSEEVMYWSGKHLARKFPVADEAELVSFFHEATWGYLTKQSESRTGVVFECSGEYIEKRLSLKETPSFSLEAGFLALQVEQQVKRRTESTYTIEKRKKKVTFTLKWEEFVK
ncbi:YslB family protein [Mangrovibacillus cuniculi]|uniref:YslB family protein n=1 Tax=Mangrovibacillus cuniculi TaxID=2593652 RepID=A0A7S8CBX7_9BACI|nr:YslB family protein [Mangrovibacillus cuniculi]QPC47159.1 YslB family protein [Mangrovibacillus cuniculi]